MVCPLAFGEVGVKERVKRVLNYKKPAFWLIVLAIIACVVVAICFLTNPKNYSEEIQVNGQIYLRQENEVETLPVGSYELGELSSILHRTKEHPSEDFAATNLDEKYAGNMLYQSGVDTNTIYLEDLSGFYIPFSTQSISDETMLAAQGIWTRKDTSNPIEMLSYLCVLDLWGGNVQEEMQISVPGNFGPHAHFSDAPSNADTLDVAMAKRAFLLMRLYPEEVFYVTWSYPDEGGEQVHREFHADEMSAILSLSSHSQIYEIPASDEDVNRLIQFLMIDEKLFLRHATEGNDFSPLLEAQKNAVWFTPEDIHDIEYMELVWHDGKRFTPLTGEGYEYITERFSEATEIRGGTGCPFHSVLYIHRSDGVVGKVLPAEDSCDMFQSNGKYYQFGDRSEPPYSDSNETFYNHFGTSLEELPHYQVASTGEPLTSEELAQFNETFIPIVYDKQGNPIGVNPLSCFFTSYYDDVRNLDFEEFMRYFPEDGSFASDAEFEALKTVEAWPFDWVETRDDMPVPIHKYQARIVDMVLKENAGITTDDLDTSDVVYLPEYDAFYNYTSDFGPGVFTCTRGEIDGDIVRLYEESDHGVDVLILKKVKNGYLIISHQQLK